MIDSSA